MTAPATVRDAPPEATPYRGGQWGVLPVLGVALPGRRTFRVWQRNRDVFVRLWKAEFIGPIIEPIIMFLALGLGLGTYVQLGGDRDYIAFLGPGVLAMFTMFQASFEALWSAYFRLDQQGTYDAILATPVRAEEIVAGEVTWAATRGAMNAVVILAVMTLLTPFYGTLESPLALLAVPISFLTGVIFASFGQAYVSQARSVSQLNYFFSLFILPMFWFSGGFFPMDELPEWARTAAWFIPLYHTIELNRGVITGDLGWAHLGHLAWLLAVAPPALWLALRLMRGRIIGR